MPKGVRLGGRQKGTPNKSTVAVKAAIDAVYKGLGGVKAMIEWAKENPGEFYTKVWVKTLPQKIEATGEDGGPMQFNFAEIRDALRRSHGIGASVPSGGNGHAGSNGGVRHEGSAAAPASPPPFGG